MDTHCSVSGLLCAIFLGGFTLVACDAPTPSGDPAPNAAKPTVSVESRAAAGAPDAAALPEYIAELGDFNALRERFNRDRGKARVVVLLEPG